MIIHVAFAAGGIQAMPQVRFPGGAIVGTAAGMHNSASHQSLHLGMKAAMLAADAAFGEMTREGAPAAGPLHMGAYGRHLKDSWVLATLQQARSAGLQVCRWARADAHAHGWCILARAHIYCMSSSGHVCRLLGVSS